MAKEVSIEGSIVLKWLLSAYTQKQVVYEGNNIVNTSIKYDGFVLPGGSRSTKTWSIIQFIIYYCQINKNKRKDILIARQQYSDTKDSVMKDFFDILNLYGIYKEEDHLKSNPQKYRLFGNTVHFSGLDAGGAHGKKYTVVWINEAFESERDAFDQLEMRLTEFFILDYNPVFTEHWILDSVNTRPEVWVAPISTQIHNPWLGEKNRRKLLSYDPSNPINIINGTADDYKWSVYALGIGAKPEGIIFPYVTWIEDFPKKLSYWFALDFGYVSDPTAMVKVAIEGNNLYLEELCYEPIDHPDLVNEMFIGRGISRNTPIIADSSDRHVSAKHGSLEFVKDLKAKGWNIMKVSKTEDLFYWISKMQEFKIHIVASTNFKKEINAYRWRMVNGKKCSQPVDDNNHLIDAARYGIMYNKKGKRRSRMWN